MVQNCRDCAEIGAGDWEAGMRGAPARAIEFEDFILDLSRGCLRRGEAEIELRPKSFALLQTFAEHPSRLLSKEELLSAVWPNVTVTEDVLTHCVSEVRRALDDREQKIIRTVPKRGYLFAAAVYSREMRSAPKVPATVAKTRIPRDAGPMPASGPQVLLGDEHGKDGNPETDLPAPITDRPSLAVLPFENLSEDRTLGLVADGLVEDIITLLARVPGFFVISRRSSLFYADRSRDIRQVGRELGIRYVVGGSIRGSGARVRIVANLFEAASGRHDWARQYDVVRRDALEIQDQIATDLISELQPQLTRVELTKIRRQRPENLGSWDHYHQAIGTLARYGFNE
jgi:adenylate cyclase